MPAAAGDAVKLHWTRQTEARLRRGPWAGPFLGGRRRVGLGDAVTAARTVSASRQPRGRFLAAAPEWTGGRACLGDCLEGQGTCRLPFHWLVSGGAEG